jgi:hypothetical protein
MKAGSNDIIRWVIDRMIAHEESITQELALTVEREARREWGGQTIPYIAKTCAADRPDPVAIRRDLDRQPNVGTVAQRHGISRRTLYRLISKP